MTARRGILVVDDDPLIRGSLYELLQSQRYEVEIASDGAEALETLKRHPFQLVLADWKMPRMDGLTLLGHIRETYPDVNVIILTGFGNISSAVEAIRQGAFDYLTKPIQAEELDATIKRALEPWSPAGDASTDTIDDPFAGIVGTHPSINRIIEMIRSIAPSSATILLEGESGTGKRVIAHAIHHADPKRRTQPFIEVSCGALPETLLESELFGHVRGAFTGAIRDKQGRFELADGGTILLDEIDAFSPALQVKLLRVLQERVFERVGDTRVMRVDVRIIAATNQHLPTLVKQGTFREDLYYRLNVIAMRLPSLRERASDLPVLIEHFIKRSSRATGKAVTGIAEEALQRLSRYAWPGNVRQLENVIERAVILTRHAKIGLEDLPDDLVDAPAASNGSDGESQPRLPQQGPALKEALKHPERELILKVLAEVRWNRSEAAKRLGIHRSTLYHKLRKLSLDPDRLRHHQD